MNILVINGPNLNMLGIREPHIYGSKTYKDLCVYIKKVAKEKKVKIKIKQSNYEGKIVTWIQQAYQKYDGIIINPGAFTHYSYAIYDALKSVNMKAIEVHLSDVNNREEFRKHSVIRETCVQSFSGKGFVSYQEAIAYFAGV